MEWVVCTLLRTTPLLALQGGTPQSRSPPTLLGGTSTAIMRSHHLTLMFPSLPHPRYPTSLHCQDRFQSDRRPRCYHCRVLCHPQSVPLLDQVCSPLLCRKLRKHLLLQFLISSLAPRLLSGQGHSVFALHPTSPLQMCRLLLLPHLSLPGRLGHASKRCLRLLPRQKRAGDEQSLMLPPPHKFLRFHLPPQFIHLLPLLFRRLALLPLRAPSASADQRQGRLTHRLLSGTPNSPTSTTTVKFVRASTRILSKGSKYFYSSSLCSPLSCKSLAATLRPCDDPTHTFGDKLKKRSCLLFSRWTLSARRSSSTR